MRRLAPPRDTSPYPVVVWATPWGLRSAPMDERGIPDVVTDGWLASGDARALAAVEEISADVSTNRVYRL